MIIQILIWIFNFKIAAKKILRLIKSILLYSDQGPTVNKNSITALSRRIFRIEVSKNVKIGTFVVKR